MHGEFQSERENIKLIIRLPEDLEFQSEEKKKFKVDQKHQQNLEYQKNHLAHEFCGI